jgi:hypothetical protein
LTPNPRATARADRQRVEGYLERHGYLLVSDPIWPSVVSVITGRPTRGSLWAHPAIHRLFALEEFLDHRGVIFSVKLLGGKSTWVHRLRWGELVGAVNVPDPEQERGLTETARRLWAQVRNLGSVRLDDLARSGPQALGDRLAARDLERRLLVCSSSEHTPEGKHELRLTSWEQLLRERHLPRPLGSAASARARIADSVFEALQDPRGVRLLPWDPSGRWRAPRGSLPLPPKSR